ncbi:hypothetical protein EV178_001466 [Coemansia sp. RSA 1646]|nr:hypothetical protein EV178_001466 [Coemansia sp. RSA 1646]KAJ2093357.1 hypothetical protein IW138_000207 [Coemansia sp. RSA 986]
MIFKSIAPPLDVPGYDIATFYINAAKKNAPSWDVVAYHDVETGESLTFKGLEKMHQQIGSGLANKLGAQPGDVVAIFASNTIYYAPALFGIVSVGAVCCTVSSAFNESELEYQLADCKARYLLVGPKQLPVVRTALAKGLVNISRERIIVLDKNAASSDGFVPIAQVFCNKPFDQKQIVNDKEKASKTLAVIVYSSGTTGLPKGVMLSHRNFIGYTLQSAAMIEFLTNRHYDEQKVEQPDPPQRLLAILPFAHIFGLTSLVTNSVAGGKTQYIMNDFSTKRFLQALQDFKIEMAPVVPSVLSQLLNYKDIAKYDLSHLKAIGSGGAPLPGGVHARIRTRFPVHTGNGFGMSETCSGICLMGNYMFQPGSVGFLYPVTEAKFVDPETGKEVGVGEKGEFCIRGVTVMLGYLNRPEETARIIDSDGFLHTGDIGYINKTGHIFITDRIKELIKYKGLQIAPAELESLLMDHPHVADAAVVGIEDKKRNTEVPRAYIVPKDLGVLALDAQSTRDRMCADVAAWLAERVAKHKRLRGGVEFVASIPRNQSGKILHRDLRIKYNAQHGPKI